MTQYRKKPVVINAWRNDIQVGPMPQWVSDAIYDMDSDGSLRFQTLEGVMRADPGDWVIQGVKGEVYPCKPDIFAATYEAV